MRKKAWAQALTIICLALAALLFAINVASYYFVDDLALILSKQQVSNKLSTYPNIKSRLAEAHAVLEELRQPFVYAPFIGWTARPYRGKTLTVGPHGDRSHDHVLNVPPDQTTVVRFFGGSTMWGAGVWDHETIPAYFDALNPDIKAYNHSQQGHNARQELARLINLYVQGEMADIVIFYDGCNEVRCLAGQLPTHVFVERIRHAMEPMTFRRGFSLLFLTHTRHLLHTLKNIFSPPSHRECSQAERLISACRNKASEIAEQLLQIWEAAHTLVTSKGGQFIAILQPIAGIGGSNIAYLDEPVCHFEMNTPVYNAIQQKIRERGHPWIYDLSHVLKGPEAYYFDRCHVTPNANLKIAQHMTELVRQLK